MREVQRSQAGTSAGEDRVQLAVAGVGLVLRGNGSLRAVLGADRYCPFLAEGPTTSTVAAATVEVTTAEVNRDPIYNSPQTALAGQTLSYRIYGGEGYLDARAGHGWLKMSAEEHIAHGALANYLRVTYALLLMRHGGFLFHSAGMVRAGRGYVFYGHSGSGKSTISRLSRQRATVLSDDLVALRPRDGAWHAYGTPFWGDFDELPKTNAGAPLRGLFSLVKGRRIKVERLPAAVAVADVVSSVPVTSQEPETSTRLVELCEDLVSRVPCYRLHFTMDDSFWSVVDGALA